MNGDFVAKVNVAEITKYGNSTIAKIKMHPVTGESEENKSFSTDTPSGTIELYISNEELIKQLNFGKYVVTFTKEIEQPSKVAHHNV